MSAVNFSLLLTPRCTKIADGSHADGGFQGIFGGKPTDGSRDTIRKPTSDKSGDGSTFSSGKVKIETNTESRKAERMIRAGAPKHKICRKAGTCLWGNPKCPSLNRPYASGQHGQKSFKKSEYSRILFEKQKLRFTYNVSEKQFRNTFDQAKRLPGVTAENLLRLLETRLDTLVFRSGIASSPFQARQLVVHGHFLLDGKKADRPSMKVRVGQTVEVRQKSKGSDWAQFGMSRMSSAAYPYLQCDNNRGSVTLVALPTMDQIPLGNIDVRQTVSYYSRG